MKNETKSNLFFWAFLAAALVGSFALHWIFGMFVLATFCLVFAITYSAEGKKEREKE